MKKFWNLNPFESESNTKDEKNEDCLNDSRYDQYWNAQHWSRQETSASLRAELFFLTSKIVLVILNYQKTSRDMRFPSMWYVRPAKAQASLRKCAVWPEPLLVTWILYVC